MQAQSVEEIRQIHRDMQIEVKHVTWEDIQRAALTDPFLHQAVTMVRRGAWTREEALMRLVLTLSVERQRLLDALQQGLSRG